MYQAHYVDGCPGGSVMEEGRAHTARVQGGCQTVATPRHLLAQIPVTPACLATDTLSQVPIYTIFNMDYFFLSPSQI